MLWIKSLKEHFLGVGVLGEEASGVKFQVWDIRLGRAFTTESTELTEMLGGFPP